MSITLNLVFRAHEHDIMQLLLQTFALLAKGRKPLDTFFLPLLHLLSFSNPFLLETNRPEMNRAHRDSPSGAPLCAPFSDPNTFLVILPMHTL